MENSDQLETGPILPEFQTNALLNSDTPIIDISAKLEALPAPVLPDSIDWHAVDDDLPHVAPMFNIVTGEQIPEVVDEPALEFNNNTYHAIFNGAVAFTAVCLWSARPDNLVVSIPFALLVGGGSRILCLQQRLNFKLFSIFKT